MCVINAVCYVNHISMYTICVYFTLWHCTMHSPSNLFIQKVILNRTRPTLSMQSSLIECNFLDMTV